MANRVDRELWTKRLRAIGMTGRLPERLTEKVVEAVQKHPVGERYQLADGRGLALCVYPDGSASYILQARTLAGRPKRIGLGSAAAVTLEQVRTAADDARRVLKAGGDPIEQKRAAVTAAEVAQASTLERFLLDVYVPHMRDDEEAKSWESTRDRIAASWKPLKDVPLAQLSESRINDLIRARKALKDEEGEPLLAGSTLRRDWATFRGMLSYALRQRAIPVMPIVGIPQPLEGVTEEPSKRYIGKQDPDEMKRLLDALSTFESTEPGGPAFLQVACALSLNTGCRRGEMLSITDKMIVMEPGAERIEMPGEICKGGKPRDLYLNSDAIAAIKRWLEIRKTLPIQSMTGELFPAAVCNWRERISQREFPRLCEAAGIEGITFKTLRTTFASLHVQRGTPIREVQKMLGHASVLTTERHYAYLAPDAGRTAARAFKVS